MSIVEMRCPLCGAKCEEKDKTTNEYRCGHCGATFRFIDSTSKTVTLDKRVHNCPLCGRPVRADEQYICTECDKQSLCRNCVMEIADKFSCKECLKQKMFVVGPYQTCPRCKKKVTYVPQYNRFHCNYCRLYVTHICPTCGKPTDYVSRYNRFHCNSCGRELTYLCPRCSKPLTLMQESNKWHCNECRNCV